MATTMTPQEKAKELVNKFYTQRDGTGLLFNVYWSNAKTCALITVEQILESRKDDVSFDDTLWQQSSEYSGKHPNFLTYWLEVKREIESL